MLSAPVLAGLAGSYLPEVATAAPAAMRFRLSTPTFRQDLEVTPQGKKAVAFKLTIEGPCELHVNGLALLREGDPEMDVDENGVAYPALEYQHEAQDGCELFLRIKRKDAKRAIVQIEDCQTACAPAETLMFRATR